MTETTSSATFVAINYIECQPKYKERFEMLFSTRAHAIDTLEGFKNMMVLRPNGEEGAYLVVSYWDSESHFKAWMKSEAFREGHKRGFADVKQAMDENRPAPMTSTFKTYEIISR